MIMTARRRIMAAVTQLTNTTTGWVH